MSKAIVRRFRFYFRMDEYIFHICTYKSLVFGTETLEIIFISDYQAQGLLLQMLSIHFMTYFLKLYI